jgi:hypothetical protein
LLHLTAQFLSDRERLLFIGLCQQDCEFFSAVSADDVDLPDLLMEDRGDLS